MASVEETFAFLEQCASKGERCPTRGDRTWTKDRIASLVRQGAIRIEISGRNWRTVTILTGPHKGKKTAPDPKGSKIWKTLDAKGTHLKTRDDPPKYHLIGPSPPSVAQPWKPRDIFTEPRPKQTRGKSQ